MYLLAFIENLWEKQRGLSKIKNIKPIQKNSTVRNWVLLVFSAKRFMLYLGGPMIVKDLIVK